MSKRLCAFTWFGGKQKHAKFLLPMLPPHTNYVEPFGGGGAILLNKKPCRGIEVYNDVDGSVVDFFTVVSDPDMFAEFYRRVNPLPYSRGLYDKYREVWRDEKNIVKRVAMWFYIARQSFSGVPGSGWSAAVGRNSQCARPVTLKVTGWASCIAGLPYIHKRITRVQIEHRDFREVLEMYNSREYLAYCDPPYVHATRRTKSVYGTEMSDKDHRDMVKILLEYEGAVVLSGYATKIYRPLERAGWDRREFKVVCTAAGNTKLTGILGPGSASRMQKRTEVVWRNPEAMRRMIHRVKGFFTERVTS